MRTSTRGPNASLCAFDRPAETLLVLIFVVLAHVAAALALSRPQAIQRMREPLRVALVSPRVAPLPAPASPAQPAEGAKRAAVPAKQASALRARPKPGTQPSVVSRDPDARTGPTTPEPSDSDGISFPDDVPASTGPRPAAAAQDASASSGERPPDATGRAPRPPTTPPRFDDPRLDNPSAEYPRLARRLGEQGEVVLRVYVTSGGNAQRIELHASSGSQRLDRAAREAVARWKFIPAREGERSVDAWLLIPIIFRLEG